MNTVIQPPALEIAASQYLPAIYDGSGGFDDIYNNDDSEGNNIREFIMTVKSTRRMSVSDFDERFMSSGEYELTNIIESGSALRIYCMSKNHNEIRYNILANEKSFSSAYNKIRTGFWLKFSLDVFTGHGKLEDYDVLSNVLAYFEDTSSWEFFVPEGSFEAVRWAFRDLTFGFGAIVPFAKYIGCAIEYSYRDPMTQAMLKKREYKKALKRILPV